MAGRHRKIPAWRRLLLRLRRSDRAARTAALQAEVVALRATVRSLRAELGAAWESAATATATVRAAESARLALELPLVRTMRPAIELDLRPAPVTELVLADLPESALLDPRQDRDGELVDLSAAEQTEAAESRRTA